MAFLQRAIHLIVHFEKSSNYISVGLVAWHKLRQYIVLETKCSFGIHTFNVFVLQFH